MISIEKSIALIIAFLLSTVFIIAQENKSENIDTPCLNSIVTIDVSSLESILLRPQTILDNPDEFWENDGAYNLAKKWHDINKISVDTFNYYSIWIEHLEEINNLSEEQKQNHVSFNLMNEIIQKKEVFDKYALAHLCSFLPMNGINLNTTVYLTAYTLPWAFMTHSNIVLNVLHSHYEGKGANDFLNTAVHEVYHIGYGKNRIYRQEAKTVSTRIYAILDSFQNEGLATYVGYKAQYFFPANDDEDYLMLEDINEVKRLLKMLNELFNEASTCSDNELKSKAWDIGTTQRAYYVVGAYMAKIIDEDLGRESLLETIEQGPIYFVSTYNKLVEPEMQVIDFKP